MRVHAYAPSLCLSILVAVIPTAACGDGARHTPSPPGVVDLGAVDSDAGSTDAGGADSGTASGDLGAADLDVFDLGTAAIAPLQSSPRLRATGSTPALPESRSSSKVPT